MATGVRHHRVHDRDADGGRPGRADADSLVGVTVIRYRVVVLVVSLVLVSTFNVGFTAWWVGHNNQQFCDVVGSTVDAYEEAPPVSPVGAAQQRNAQELYRRLGCT